MTDKSVYEGAGFLLFRASTGSDGKKKFDFVLGERQKKPQDDLNDLSEELEYQGGKPEKDEKPHETAENELNEEVGCFRDENGTLISVLDADWKDRAKTLWTFQPISKKWIWLFLLQLNGREYERFKVQDVALGQWDVNEKRSFSALTGRNELCRKSLKGLYLVSANDILKHVADFVTVPASANRLKDAKQFRKNAAKFIARRMTDETKTLTHPLRAFNLVVFEQNVLEISQAVQVES